MNSLCGDTLGSQGLGVLGLGWKHWGHTGVRFRAKGFGFRSRVQGVELPSQELSGQTQLKRKVKQD